MNILHVVGARPNFMKMAPVFNALKKYKVTQKIVHTGQHYSHSMSGVFFAELRIKAPDIDLNVGSSSHAKQVAAIMSAFEDVVLTEKPDLVLVYGDVNSTMAAALVCAKLGVRVGHVEAGLRSFDLTMPEEINRMVTDRLSSMYFTPSTEAEVNLLQEGAKKKDIHFVGNVMIDTLVTFLPQIKKQVPDIPFKSYCVVTLHRPSNVDDPEKLKAILLHLYTIAEKIPVVFPVHPRTREMLKQIVGLPSDTGRVLLIDPMSYVAFLGLVYHSSLVITDSGGIQEETTYLKLPCLTLRENTERPVTVEQGSNTLIGNNFALLHRKVGEVLSGRYKKGKIPARWDGKASERLAKVIVRKK